MLDDRENTKKRNLFSRRRRRIAHIRGMFGVLRPLRRSNILFERSREGRVCRAKSHNCIICVHAYACMRSSLPIGDGKKYAKRKTWKRGTINVYYLLGICFRECAITWSANANVDFLFTIFRLFIFFLSLSLVLSHSSSLTHSFSHILSVFFSHG